MILVGYRGRHALGESAECMATESLLSLLAWAFELLACALDFGANHAGVNVVVD